MSGISAVLKDPSPPEGAARQFWRVFDVYLDSIRSQRDENGNIPQSLLPPMTAWNAYFMALAADQQGYWKVYRSVQVAEQEFDLHLSKLSYTNVLRACSIDGSEESAQFAIKIVAGLMGSEQGPEKKALNFAALACKNAGMVDDAVRLLKEIRERYPEGLRSDFHVRRTHENVLNLCAHPDRLDHALELANVMSEYQWELSPGPAAAILHVALRERKEPEYLLQVLGRLVLPGTGDHRVEGPFLEEGVAMAVLAEAARCGHVELALRAWDFLEYSLLPLDLPKPPAHDSQHVDSESSREAGKTPTHHRQGEFGDMLDTSILLPINKPSIAAFQSLIDTFANARELRQAFRMVWQLQQVHPNRPDAVAFQTALTTIVNTAAESPEAADAAYFELEDMHAKGEPVTGPMLDCVVAACSQMGDMGRAFETFEAYSALGLEPDAQAYNAVIMGCINHGLTASVPKILEEMEEKGVAFNALTWSLHVEYHVVRGDAQAAATVHQAAQRAGVQIRPSTFEKLIARCERNGEAALLDFYQEARRKDYKDSYLDLSRLLQWRWKDRGGMQVLTGSKVFLSRSSRFKPRLWARTEPEAVN
ncbi:g6330 [Coccomyxa elongata]